MSVTTNPLDAFLPITRAWFEQTLGQPPPPQQQGWSPIQRGEHTLILAPTGSGKTLSAFLWGIDQLFRGDGRGVSSEGRVARGEAPSSADGVPSPNPSISQSPHSPASTQSISA